MQIGPRILVIEDDPAVVTLLTDFLGEMEGYDVRLQKHGEDAHGAIKHGRPRLVILDLRLGGAERKAAGRFSTSSKATPKPMASPCCCARPRSRPASGPR